MEFRVLGLRVLGLEFRDIAKTGAIFNLVRKRLWDKTPGHILGFCLPTTLFNHHRNAASISSSILMPLACPPLGE